MWQAVSTGSMLVSGRAPCEPRPVTVMSKNAPPAIEGPALIAYLPTAMSRAVVDGEDGVAGKTLEQPILQHRQRAADTFLAGLEDEIDRAVEGARLGQIARGAQQHRGVPVMAAGVHPARIAAAMVDLVGFLHRQRVHVGAQADRLLAVAGTQHADHAGAADAAMHLDPPFGKLRGDHVRWCDAPPARVPGWRAGRGGFRSGRRGNGG